MTKLTGSYLISQSGNIMKVDIHVPSTTYMGRGIYRLSPTDMEFLLNEGLITLDEAYSMLLQDYLIFINDNGFSLLTPSQYRKFADLKYAPKMDEFIFNVSAKCKSTEDIQNLLESYKHVPYEEKRRWYQYLCDEYCKLYIYKDVVEFRICGSSGFDWNEVIIDDVLLNDEYDFQSNMNYRFTIMHEDSSRYKPYFVSATLTQILENDTTVMSSEDVCYSERTVTDDGELVYT